MYFKYIYLKMTCNVYFTEEKYTTIKELRH